MPKPTIYTGTFIHTPLLGELEVLENKAIFVDENGTIVLIAQLNDDWAQNGGLGTKGAHSVTMEEIFGWVKGLDDSITPISREEKWQIVNNLPISRGRRRWWFPGFIGRCVFGSFVLVVFVQSMCNSFWSIYFLREIDRGGVVIIFSSLAILLCNS